MLCSRQDVLSFLEFETLYEFGASTKRLHVEKKRRLLKPRMTFFVKLMERGSPRPRRCIQATGNRNKSKSDAAFHTVGAMDKPVKKLTGPSNGLYP